MWFAGFQLLQSRLVKSRFELWDNSLLTNRQWSMLLWKFGIHGLKNICKLPEGEKWVSQLQRLSILNCNLSSQKTAMPSSSGGKFQARILYPAKLLHTSIECRHFKSCKVSKYFSSSLMLLCDLLHPPKGRRKRQWEKVSNIEAGNKILKGHVGSLRWQRIPLMLTDC